MDCSFGGCRSGVSLCRARIGLPLRYVNAWCQTWAHGGGRAASMGLQDRAAAARSALVADCFVTEMPSSSWLPIFRTGLGVSRGARDAAETPIGLCDRRIVTLGEGALVSHRQSLDDAVRDLAHVVLE